MRNYNLLINKFIIINIIKHSIVVGITSISTVSSLISLARIRMEFISREMPVVIERDYDSITIGWPISTATSKPIKYELQMKEGDNEWLTLSSSLSNNIIRKKNCNQIYQYSFRYKINDDSNDDSTWSNESIPVTVLDKTAIVLMNPPTLLSKDNNSITLQWDNISNNNNDDGYYLRYRIDNDINWININTPIKSLSVRKKGLLHGKSYYFSIKPVNNIVNDSSSSSSSSSSRYEWSCSSSKLTVASLSLWVQNNISIQLLSKQGLVKTDDAISGKVLAVYFSASW